MNSDAPPTEEPAGKRPIFFRIVRAFVLAVVWLILAIATLWAYGALVIDAHSQLLACGYLLVTLVLIWVLRPMIMKILGVCLAFSGVLAWWYTQEPRQDRDWKPDLARTAWAEINGDLLTIHEVRNNDYRTEDDFTVHYETRQYHFSKLKGMDVFVNYWGLPYMAHPIISYDFGEDGHVCFSIETRSEKGEGYSPVRGLYRQFEVMYVVSDERDVIRLRANYRKGEDVYRYQVLDRDPKASLLEYITAINELHQKPKWYHAIANNCTTSIRHQRALNERAPFDWRIIVNGYMDELMYEKQVIPTDVPFEQAKKRAYMNPRIRELDQDPDFSAKLRQ